MSVQATETIDPFSKALGAVRGAPSKTPWMLMDEEERTYAIDARRELLLAECMYPDGSRRKEDRVLSDEIRAIFLPVYEQAFKDAHIEWNTVDANLLEKFLTQRYAEHQPLQETLHAQAITNCESAYTAWLDCGDAPGIGVEGPWSYQTEDGSTCCPACKVSEIRQKELSKQKRYTGIVSTDRTTVDAALPGNIYNASKYDTSLVQITSSYIAGYRFYWQGYDLTGRYWTGNISNEGPSRVTEMWNSSRFDDTNLRK